MKKMAKRDVAKVVDEDFSSVLEIITRRRNRALMAVNVELLMTNWEIGAFLSPRIHAGSWDAAVVGRLADFLKRQDPTLRGYGKSNLYNMAKGLRCLFVGCVFRPERATSKAANGGAGLFPVANWKK